MDIDKLIERVHQSEEPIYIKHSKRNLKAVIISKMEYNSLIETIENNSIPGLAEKIKSRGRIVRRRL